MDGAELIFCMIRKKWFNITPEEWVRQNFLLYLADVMMYSKSLIAVEKGIRVGEVDKRFDIVLYDKLGKPYIVIECKEPSVKLTSGTLQQVLRYNIFLDAPYLIITNGIHTHGFHRSDYGFREIDDFPSGK